MVECAGAECGGRCTSDRPPRVEEKTLCCDGEWRYTEWSSFTSATCGTAYRYRKPISCSCEGHCGPLTMVEEKPLEPCCVPNVGEYQYGTWSEWSTDCNYGERTRSVISCSANECGFCGGNPITTQQRLRPCDEGTVCPDIVLGAWSAWNASCGAVSRVRSYENCADECKELCEQPCYTEDFFAGPCCVAENGRWSYSVWSAWESACQGFQTRSREAVACNATCGGSCGPAYTIQVSETPTEVEWVYGPWSVWSGSCGRVFRYREPLYCPSACPKGCDEQVTSETKELPPCCEPQPGAWLCSPWSSWSDSCTVQSRHRTCDVCLSVCDGPCPDKEVFQERESTKICEGDQTSANEDSGSGTNNIDEVASGDGDDFLGPLLIALVAAAMLLLLLGAAYARTKKRNRDRAAAAGDGGQSPGSGRRPNVGSFAGAKRDQAIAGTGPVAPVKNPVFGSENPNYVPDFAAGGMGAMANPTYT